MSERRLSARSSAIENRRQLEERLQERERRRNSRLASRSQSVDNIRHQSIVEADELEFNLIEVPTTVQPVADQIEEDNRSQVEGSAESLDWDHSGDPPSFISAASSPNNGDQGAILNKSVHEQDISLFLDNLANCQVDNSQDSVALRPVNSVRRNTSTDNYFLEENPPSRVRTWSWPPRHPSQEPDDDGLLLINSFDFNIFSSEEEDLAMPMDEQLYSQRLRVVKLTELRVKDVRDQFLANNVQKFHLSVYESRLKDIREEHKLFIGAANDLVIDLDTGNEVDQSRVNFLNRVKQELSESISKNENDVLTKVDGFLTPSSSQSQQAIDPHLTQNVHLQSQKEREEEKEKAIREDKKKRVEIDIEDITTRATLSSISEVLVLGS